MVEPTHALVPIEPTELEVRRLSQNLRAMRQLGCDYTLTDYARSVREAVLAPHLKD